MIIGVTNHKGGVGKTSLCLNLGLALASRGKRVILIDADAQGTLTEALGFDHAPGFYDVLVRNANLADIVRQIPNDNFAVAGEPVGFAGLIPSNNETRHIADSISAADAVLTRFKKLRDHTDFILFDMSPTESLLHPLIYIACDAVIHPVQCEDWAVRSLRRTMKYVETSQAYRRGFGLRPTETMAIVPNCYRDTRVHRAYLEQLQGEFGGHVTPPIKQRVIWSEAAAFNLPVYLYEPDSEASGDIWTLADVAEGIHA